MTPALLALALAAAPAPPSPWDGDWVLDAGRSSAAAKEQAADGYRFHVKAGVLRWEIPSLREDFDIRIGGPPSPVKRPGGDQTMAIGARAEGPAVFAYQVSKAGKVVGEGRMTLVDGGKAWVDIVWPAGRPLLASQIVYLKRS